MNAQRAERVMVPIMRLLDVEWSTTIRYFVERRSLFQGILAVGLDTSIERPLILNTMAKQRHVLFSQGGRETFSGIHEQPYLLFCLNFAPQF